METASDTMTRPSLDLLDNQYIHGEQTAHTHVAADGALPAAATSVHGSGWTRERQKPARISMYVSRMRLMMPARILDIWGIGEGDSIMYAVRSAGSPLTGKNSSLGEEERTKEELGVLRGADAVAVSEQVSLSWLPMAASMCKTVVKGAFGLEKGRVDTDFLSREGLGGSEPE